jgi:hypothetical protein
MRGTPVTRIGTAALAIVAALALVACGGGGSAAATPPSATPTQVERPSSTAQLTIAVPKNGAVVNGSTVELRVDLEGARVVPATTTHIVPDEGHLHVLLDDVLISMTEGLHQTIPDVSPGLHRLTVEFVASDHAPFDPRVVAVVAFEVQP